MIPKIAQPESLDKNVEQSWRQGSFLPDSAFTALNLGTKAGENTLAIVLTHDCDCVRDEQQEPLLEIIFAREVQSVDANLTNAKSLRKLHLRTVRNGVEIAISVEANSRMFVTKQELSSFSPSPSYSLPPEERFTLVRWFTSRFTRTALPDELVRRLEPMKKYLEKAGKGAPFAILGIYVDFDPQDEIDGASELYELSVAVVYSTLEKDSSTVAQKAARMLMEQLEKLYRTVETVDAGLQWRDIEVRQCEAVPDTIFSLRSALVYKLYHLDYLSLRQRPIAELPG